MKIIFIFILNLLITNVKSQALNTKVILEEVGNVNKTRNKIEFKDSFGLRIIKIYSGGIDSKLIYEYTLKDGLKNGWFVKYQNKDTIAYSLFFENDTLKKATYVKDNLNRLTFNIRNNLCNGSFVSYYPNGKIESSGIYKDNLRIGNWIFFDDNGIPTKEVKFKGYFIKILLDRQRKQIITLNEKYDTINKVKFNPQNITKLEQKYNLNKNAIFFPLLIEPKVQEWKYVSDGKKIIKNEIILSTNSL